MSSGTPVDLTEKIKKKLRDEIIALEHELHDELPKELKKARAHGDLSENADYHAAKDSQGKMESRIRQIQATLAKAEIVEEMGASSSAGTVSAGSIVSIRYEGDEDVERFLVGSIEERHEDLNVVSPGSPLGQALLGKGPGEVVEYEAPGGTLRVEIVKVGT